jgi:hypothetical protein
MSACSYWYYIQGGAETTDPLWLTLIFYTTSQRWNEKDQFYVQSKQFTSYLLLLIDDVLKVASFVFNTWPWTTHRTVKISAQQLSICGSISSRRARFSSCFVRRWFLYTDYFKYPRRKKSGTVSSGDPTGHGIPDKWKCSSSLITALHIPPIHCRKFLNGMA